MPTRASPPPGADSYMTLIERFPLRVRDDRDHAEAVELIEELIGRPLDPGADDYLDNLITLVEKYEREHHTPPGDLPPRDLLRALMRHNHLTQADIGRIIGSPTAVSMFLNGRRELSKAHIRALADHFRIDAGALL